MNHRQMRSLQRGLYLASRRVGDVDTLVTRGPWALARRILRRRELRAFYGQVNRSRYSRGR